MERSKMNSGWTVTLAGAGINLALGVLYSWSVISKYLTTPLSEGGWGWQETSASLPYATACGIFAIMMVFAGRAQDKYGPRIVASIGGALTGTGLIIAGYAGIHDIVLMVAGFGILAGSGIGLGYASATPAAVKWFHPSKKGLISGIVVAGFGLASVYIAPVTEALLKQYGMNRTFLLLGGTFLIVTILLSQFLRNPPEGYAPPAPKKLQKTGDEKITPLKAHNDFTWQEMVRTPQFYLIWLMYAFAAFAGLMIIGKMAKIAAAQLPPDINLGYLLVAVLAIGNAAGRIAAGFFSDTLGRTKTMLIVFLSQAVLLAFMPGIRTPYLLTLAAALVGFFYGANLSLFPAITGDYFGTKNLGVNYGLVFTAWGVGGVFGSMVAGKIKDLTGSFGQAYLAAAVLCLLACGVTFFVKEPVTAKEAEADMELTA